MRVRLESMPKGRTAAAMRTEQSGWDTERACAWASTSSSSIVTRQIGQIVRKLIRYQRSRSPCGFDILGAWMAQRLVAFALALAVFNAPVAGEICQAICAQDASSQ